MYSRTEDKLIEWFGFSYIKNHTEPIVMYRIMVEKAFRDNMKGDAVKSLRRCMHAFIKGSPNRNTIEWDKMIHI